MADSLWNSVFGLALRRMNCISPQADCEQCTLRTRCDCFVLTRGTVAPKADSASLAGKINSRPPPLIFHGPVRDFSLRIPANATFSTNLVLVGKGNDRLATVIHAMALAGDLGIGRNRSRFQLLRVMRSGPDLPNRQIAFDHDTPPPPASAYPPEVPELIQIDLLTPWLLPSTEKNFQPEGPETLVRDFLGKIVRRISLMQHCHTGQPLETDFKALSRKIEKINLPRADLIGTAGYRHGRGTFMAVRGSFVLDMNNVSEIWPFLWTGQWLNVPKMAAKGFGRYEICAL